MIPHAVVRAASWALLASCVSAAVIRADTPSKRLLPTPGLHFQAALVRAAEDSTLAPWQRSFMLGLARGGTDRTTETEELPPWSSIHGADAGVWNLFTPPTRSEASAIYDPIRDRMLVFGGRDGGTSFRNDVWALSLTGEPTWSELAPSGFLPHVRAGHAAIYDSRDDRMVIFGGFYNETGYYNDYLSDTWALSLSGTIEWNQLFPVWPLPADRSGHTATYDPVRNRMVIFGGGIYNNFKSHYFDDLWALSLSDSVGWSELHPAGARPGARFEHAAIYDPVRDRLVVFGGAPSDDLWALPLADSATWSPLTPAGYGPLERTADTAIYDPIRDRMVVQASSETWSLSLGPSSAWESIETGPTVLPGRRNQTAVYDSVRDRMVVFGGIEDTSGGYRNDAWALSLFPTPAWTAIAPLTEQPVNREAHTAIYDPLRHRMVLFGGVQGSALRDIWSLGLSEGPDWERLDPSGTEPEGRWECSAVYDPIRDRMIVFGGAFHDGTAWHHLNDTWELSFTPILEWRELAVAGTAPAARRGHSAIYDAVRDQMVVFGGYDEVSFFDDVWTLSLSGASRWDRVDPLGATPSRRWWHSAFYDPVRDQMVVFGGTDSRTLFNDVWALSLERREWTSIKVSGDAPLARWGHSTIYDPMRDRMVLFGGFDGRYLGDIWQLALAPLQWTPLGPSGDRPAPRMRHTSVYDPGGDRMVIFGGHEQNYLLNDGWFVTWGAPQKPRLSCPGQVSLSDGMVRLAYEVANPISGTRNIDWRLDLDSPAPGLPLRGSLQLSGAAAETLRLEFPLPERSAGTLTMAGWFSGAAGNEDSCEQIWDRTTGTLATLLSADAQPGLVLLRWHVGANRDEVTVDRRVAGEEWRTLGHPACEAGVCAYEDRSVREGFTYEYRLAIGSGSMQTYTPGVTVTVPRAGTMTLEALLTNPARNELIVAFVLPDAAAAELEVFDATGRRLERHRLAGFGEGRHTLRLGANGAWLPGIYLVRLRQSGRSVCTRAVVLR